MIGKRLYSKKITNFFFRKTAEVYGCYSDIPFVQQMLLIEIITLSASVALR